MFGCNTCDKHFRTENALNQHVRAAHPFPFACDHCDKAFQTQQAADQHTNDAHRRSATVARRSIPAPPVDGDGYWIDHDRFRGNKSIGAFTCDCGQWTSFHAFKNYTQCCSRQCKKWVLPTLMWVNKGNRPEDRVKSDDKPHMQNLCGKCVELGRRCWIRD